MALPHLTLCGRNCLRTSHTPAEGEQVVLTGEVKTEGVWTWGTQAQLRAGLCTANRGLGGGRLLDTESSSLSSTPNSAPRRPAARPLSEESKTVLWAIRPARVGRPKTLVLEVPHQIQMSPHTLPRTQFQAEVLNFLHVSGQPKILRCIRNAYHMKDSDKTNKRGKRWQ